MFAPYLPSSCLPLEFFFFLRVNQTSSSSILENRNFSLRISSQIHLITSAFGSIIMPVQFAPLPDNFSQFQQNLTVH